MGANMVREISSAHSDLVELIGIWSDLPAHIKAAIMALVRTAVDG